MPVKPHNDSHSGPWFRLRWATLRDLQQVRHEIMSAISDFAAKQKAFNDRIDSAVDGLTGDIQGLKDLIQKLQDSAGQITPADQALLDEIQTRTEAIANRLSALDELTPPVPPAG